MLMNITANPDAETLKLFLIVSGALISILLVIIGYFIKHQFSDQELKNKEQVGKISKMVDTLGQAVDNLKSVVDIIKAQQDDRDPRTERRLNEHGKKLEEHENRLYIIETRCTMTQAAKEKEKKG